MTNPNPEVPLISVATPTLGRASLSTATRSIFAAAMRLADWLKAGHPEISLPPVLVEQVLCLDGPEVNLKSGVEWVNEGRNDVLSVRMCKLSQKFGAAVARMKAIEQCTGRIQMFLDDDCTFHPEVFVEVLKHFDSEGKLALGEATWTHFFRFMVCEDKPKARYPDAIEAIGLTGPPFQGLLEGKPFADTNCFAVSRAAAQAAHGAWISENKLGHGEDRRFFQGLLAMGTRPKPIMRFLVDYTARATLFSSNALYMLMYYGYPCPDPRVNPTLKNSLWPGPERDLIAKWADTCWTKLKADPEFEQGVQAFRADGKFHVFHRRSVLQTEDHLKRLPEAKDRIHLSLVPGTEMFLADCAAMARGFYESHGYEVTVSNRYLSGVFNVILGAGDLKQDPGYPMEGTTLWNLEHLYPESPFLAQGSIYPSLLAKYNLWDFNQANLKYLTETLKVSPEKVQLVKLGWSSYLVMEPLTRSELDEPCKEAALIYGGMNHRRTGMIELVRRTWEKQKVAKDIKACNNNLAGLSRRLQILNPNHPVILNLHLYAAQNLACTRVIHAMANGKLVISEESKDDQEYQDLLEGFVRVPARDHVALAREIAYYMEHPEEAKALALKGQQLVQARTPVFPLK